MVDYGAKNTEMTNRVQIVAIPENYVTSHVIV